MIVYIIYIKHSHETSYFIKLKNEWKDQSTAILKDYLTGYKRDSKDLKSLNDPGQFLPQADFGNMTLPCPRSGENDLGQK